MRERIYAFEMKSPYPAPSAARAAEIVRTAAPQTAPDRHSESVSLAATALIEGDEDEERRRGGRGRRSRSLRRSGRPVFTLVAVHRARDRRRGPAPSPPAAKKRRFTPAVSRRARQSRQ